MKNKPLPLFENFTPDNTDQIQKRLDLWKDDKNTKVATKDDISNWFENLPASLVYIVAKDQDVTKDIQDPFKEYWQSLSELIDLVFKPLIDGDEWDEINSILTSAWDKFDKNRESYANLELKKMGPINESLKGAVDYERSQRQYAKNNMEKRK